VTSALRRLRPLLISVVALILTAGIAFAAKPSTPAPGLTVATQASGKTVPVVSEGDQNTETDQSTETSTDASTDTSTDPAANGDHCATDPRTATPDQLAAMNHGAIVCWAAHQATPAGFANHGAWVSSWAKQNHGADKPASTGTHASAKGKSHKP
jgi:hypothetical protein